MKVQRLVLEVFRRDGELGKRRLKDERDRLEAEEEKAELEELGEEDWDVAEGRAEVDWEDSDRRCREVVDRVHADCMQRRGQELEEEEQERERRPARRREGEPRSAWSVPSFPSRAAPPSFP